MTSQIIGTKEITERYSRALFEVSSKNDGFKAIAKSFRMVLDILELSNSLVSVMSSSTISKDIKFSIIDDLSKRYKISLEVKNLLYILINNKRVFLLEQIYRDFQRRIDTSQGIKNIEIISYSKLSKKIETALTKTLSKFLGKEVRLNNKIDESLIGGFLIRFDSDLYDASIKSYLQRLQNQTNQEIQNI